jgi:methionine-rich copper-binding protein CopC
MFGFFTTIFLISFLAALVGTIRPSLLKLTSRKQVYTYSGMCALVAFIFVVITAPPAAQNQQVVQPNPVEQKVLAQQPATTTKAASDVDRLRTIVASVLQGNTNMSHESRLRSVDVVSQTGATPPGGWGVFVEFNSDDNLSSKTTKNGIEMQMSDIYTALYTSGIDVRTASAAAYLSLTDKYGNASDQMVYKSILAKDVASKVNWSADKTYLKLGILPGLWDTTILSPVLTH